MKTIVNIPSRQNTMRELRDYLMIALVGWLFVMAVYYTAKRMNCQPCF